MQLDRTTFVLNGTTLPVSGSPLRIKDLFESSNPAVSKIRIEHLDGRDYLVVPMVMLVEGVHKGSRGAIYYSQEELARTPKQWNCKPIVLEHPAYGDTATDLEIYKKQACGMVMNANFIEGKLKAEAWLDLAKVKEKCPEILDSIDHGLPIEISTGLFSELVEENGVWGNEQYKCRITNIRADHLAILPSKQGACSLSDGAGLLVNQAHSETDDTLTIFTVIQNATEYMPASNIPDNMLQQLNKEKSQQNAAQPQNVVQNPPVVTPQQPIDIPAIVTAVIAALKAQETGLTQQQPSQPAQQEPPKQEPIQPEPDKQSAKQPETQPSQQPQAKQPAAQEQEEKPQQVNNTVTIPTVKKSDSSVIVTTGSPAELGIQMTYEDNEHISKEPLDLGQYEILDTPKDVVIEKSIEEQQDKILLGDEPKDELILLINLLVEKLNQLLGRIDGYVENAKQEQDPQVKKIREEILKLRTQVYEAQKEYYKDIKKKDVENHLKRLKQEELKKQGIEVAIKDIVLDETDFAEIERFKAAKGAATIESGTTMDMTQEEYNKLAKLEKQLQIKIAELEAIKEKRGVTSTAHDSTRHTLSYEDIADNIVRTVLVIIAQKLSGKMDKVPLFAIEKVNEELGGIPQNFADEMSKIKKGDKTAYKKVMDKYTQFIVDKAFDKLDGVKYAFESEIKQLAAGDTATRARLAKKYTQFINEANIFPEGLKTGDVPGVDQREVWLRETPEGLALLKKYIKKQILKLPKKEDIDIGIDKAYMPKIEKQAEKVEDEFKDIKKEVNTLKSILEKRKAAKK